MSLAKRSEKGLLAVGNCGVALIDRSVDGKVRRIEWRV
jgi:hypothetical protein